MISVSEGSPANDLRVFILPSCLFVDDDEKEQGAAVLLRVDDLDKHLALLFHCSRSHPRLDIHDRLIGTPIYRQYRNAGP